MVGILLGLDVESLGGKCGDNLGGRSAARWIEVLDRVVTGPERIFQGEETLGIRVPIEGQVANSDKKSYG